MKILLLGDLHLSDRPPSSCTESYTDDLFDLMQQTVQLAEERQYAAVVQAGDLFHFKVPSRTSHRLVQRVIDLVDSYPCPFFVVPGNHDIQQDRLESIFVTQPLGVVLRSSNAHQLHGWAHDLPVFGVPWLQTWNDKDSEGRPTAQSLRTVSDVLKPWVARVDGSFPALVVTHAPFYPPGKELEYEHFPTEIFSAEMRGSGSLYYGHVHEPHGEYVVGGVRFCNNGALSRGSLHEYNLSRQVCVTEWDSVTGEFSLVPLKAKVAGEVFRLVEVQEKRDVQKQLDDFLSSIGQATIEVTSVEAVLEHVRSLKLGVDMTELIASLLEEATA
jgi:DNA repair exonuclease SbcCD nuclease subunit